jgi:hypothetical protein
MTATLPVLPLPVHRVLRRARARLRALPANERPDLAAPSNALSLFAPGELAELASWQCWPLPPEVVRWLREAPPAGRRRRRRREPIAA